MNGKIKFTPGKFRRLTMNLINAANLASRVNSDINLKSANFTPCKFQKYIKFYTVQILPIKKTTLPER